MDPDAADLNALKESSSVTKKDLKRAYNAHRRSERAISRGSSRIPESTKTVALMLYAMSGNPDFSVEFLKRYWLKKYRVPSMSRADLKVQVETLVIDTPQNRFNMLLEPALPRYVKALNIARTFASECSVATWVEVNNEKKGVAPPTSAVLEAFDDEIRGNFGLDLDLYHDYRSDSTLARHRMWAYRFRSRWRIGLGRLRENTEVPVPERQAKVACFAFLFQVKPCPFFPFPHFGRLPSGSSLVWEGPGRLPGLLFLGTLYVSR